MGYFVNTLPFRIRSNHDESLDQFFNTVREVVLNGLTHMEIPLQKNMNICQFIDVNQKLKILCSKSCLRGRPVVNHPAQQMDTMATRKSYLKRSRCPVKFALMLSMRLACNEEGETVLEGSMAYDTNKFHCRSINRFAQYF